MLSNASLKYTDANSKCQELGGFILEPMNDMYTEDLRVVLTNYTKNTNETAWWIGEILFGLYLLLVSAASFQELSTPTMHLEMSKYSNL